MHRVRNVRADDQAALGRVLAYIAANQDPGIRPRPDAMIATAIGTGLALEIVDEAGAIEGCSLLYRFDADRIYSEIGTQLITANRRGLQVFLASLHLVQLRIELDSPQTENTFAVVSAATPSEHNLVDVVGMSSWQPPQSLVEARAAMQVPFLGGKRVIRADEAAVAKAFAAMRGWHRTGNDFTTPKMSEPLMLDLGWFDPANLTAM